MKAFTVYQPYAFAIVAGLKGYEIRPRRTNIRGRVAVHAGKKDALSVIRERDAEEQREILKNIYRYFGITDGAVKRLRAEAGAVIGTVEIVDCVPIEEIVNSISPLERALGDYSPGRFAWVMKDPVRFEKPIPARGNQGWWNWEEPAEGGEAS